MRSVVGKTLEGLFLMPGEQEKKIRKDPGAQTTSLLKAVFWQGVTFAFQPGR